MRRSAIFFFLLLAGITNLHAQLINASLEDCFRLAEQQNTTIRQTKQSVETRLYQFEAAKLAALPKVDLLGGYQYMSDPIRVNLQSVREGIVEGSSRQNVNAANEVFHQITGNDLSTAAQNTIYEGSKNIINGIYPDYNPELSRQQYFTAGIALHMPIYLGGKLAAAREVADKQLLSGKLNVQVAQSLVAYAIVTQYLQILYLNSMIQNQQKLVEAFQKTESNAASLVHNEIIPPYQRHWASVALSQAGTGLKTLVLEKENTTLMLQHLIGTDSSLTIMDTLMPASFSLPREENNFWENNTGYQWLQSKTDEARSAVKATRSLSLPNIFGIANYQFLRKDLPVITPPWLVGVNFQWNVFSGFENGKHLKASQSLVKESELLALEKKQNLQLNIQIAKNKLKAFREEMNTLDDARKEAATTVDMVQKRLQNQLSSVKDVNDALQIQLEADKAYYTSVLTYDLAVATYLNLIGNPKSMATYLK